VFDTFQGLPIHALIVHATVVLIPLMALVTVFVAARPRLRKSYAWWVVAVDAVLVVLTWVTIQSGERLEERLGDNPGIERHADLGRQLLWFVVALAVAALVVALTTDRSRVPAIGGTALSAVVGLLVLVWVVRTGHAGAEAVWSGLPDKPN
jgi:cell division protein FtsW (lipid II flippase)